MKISIIIPLYNSQNTINKLLDSIINNYDKKIEEVIIVDDGSTDNSVEIVKSYKQKFIKLIELKNNFGRSIARNTGAKYAKGDVLFFLDSDVVLTQNTIKNLINSFNGYVECLVGVYSKEPANKKPFSLFKALMEFFWIKNLKECSYFMPACGAIKKTIFEKTGGFNPEYRELEEVDFGYRLGKLCKIYLDNKIQVKHHFPSFFSCVKNYYKRGFVWTRLFLKRKKFDNFGTTKSGGLSSIIAFFSILSLLFSFLFFPVTILLFFIFMSIFIVLNCKLFIYLGVEKKISFMIYSIYVWYILSIIIAFSAITSIVTLPLKSRRVIY